MSRLTPIAACLGALLVLEPAPSGAQTRPAPAPAPSFPNENREAVRKHLNRAARFRQVTERAGVAVLLANHQAQDLSLYSLDLLRNRRLKPGMDEARARASDYLDPHPYVLPPETYQRFLQVQAECVRVAAARQGQPAPQ
ncbi:hypothetical protein [Muricoccus aerilatus]|uniref:hypothetical protein n=1 Tax=Muricoccus aerilatus TaxID=452982 RepID=UPI0005C1DAA5|nr:hypothetical protein [Roseomonas aerilata]